jgi:hypothetical protein
MTTIKLSGFPDWEGAGRKVCPFFVLDQRAGQLLREKPAGALPGLSGSCSDCTQGKPLQSGIFISGHKIFLKRPLKPEKKQL